MMILWFTLLNALDQSARRLMTAVGLLGLSVFLRMKSIIDIRAWDQELMGSGKVKIMLTLLKFERRKS